MSDIPMAISLFAPPYGADELLLAAFPTLKRGANDRSASGAIGIEPVWSTKGIHAIAHAPSTNTCRWGRRCSTPSTKACRWGPRFSTPSTKACRWGPRFSTPSTKTCRWGPRFSPGLRIQTWATRPGPWLGTPVPCYFRALPPGALSSNSPLCSF